MSNSVPAFRTVMRGYEPAEVDRRIAELTALVQKAQQQSTQLSQRLDLLTNEAARRRSEAGVAPVEPTFQHLGERVGKILSLADDEAHDIRQKGDAEAKQRLADITASTARMRSEADTYATETRTGAEREAARIVEEAKRTADQLLDEADRQATARREEAEAVYERQRAAAAQAAADFEQTLANRRQKAETDFRERSTLDEQQLKNAQRHVATLKADSERAATEAARKSATLLDEAEQKAQQIVAEAVAHADRVRAESDRQLAAASQRRDSINAQLTNVRQMLGTLSGAVPAAVAPGLDSQADDAASAEDSESPDTSEKPSQRNAANASEG
jgi:cell division septum initiation protein DivIVA